MNTTTRIPYIAALRLRIATWWAGLWPLAWTACVAALCAAAALLLVVMFRPAAEQAPPPAATQTNPLAPLVARLDALEADVVDLQDRAADLEGLQPAASPRPRVSRAPDPAKPPAPTRTTTQRSEFVWEPITDFDAAVSATR